MPHYKAGTIKLLAQSASKRAPTLQEVPTLEEAGYKGLVLDAWYAAFVPKGTPPAIVAQLNKEMNEALKDPKLLRTSPPARSSRSAARPRRSASSRRPIR